MLTTSNYQVNVWSSQGNDAMDHVKSFRLVRQHARRSRRGQVIINRKSDQFKYRKQPYFQNNPYFKVVSLDPAPLLWIMKIELNLSH